MPRNVTMEWPYAWVIRDKLDDDEPGVSRVQGALNELHVTSLSILLMDNGAVPDALPLGQNVEVMAVQMHRVGSTAEILEKDPNAGVGAEVVNIPLWVEGI